MADLKAQSPDLTIGVSHAPYRRVLDSFTGLGADMIFAGHTHGGQILLPGLGPVATASRFGTKYLSGWAQGPRWRVYTTVGIGTSMVPVRVGTTPEIIVFKLRSETSA